MKHLSNILISCLAACLWLAMGTACTADATEGQDVPPASDATEVMLVIDAHAPATRATVDYAKEIRTIRIYAYPHGTAGTATAPIGYYYQEVAGNGPYYCSMDLPLTETTVVDFLVTLNDGSMSANPSSTALGETSTRQAVENYMFTANTYRLDEEGKFACPMSNLLAEGKTDADTDTNNRSFTIRKTTAPQLIDIVATRAMARLRLQFAKVGEEEASIDEATLYRGPRYTWLMKEPVLDNQKEMYDTPERLSDNFLAASVPVTQVVESVDNAGKEYQTVAETYMLENLFGTDNPNERPEGTDGNGNRMYWLKIVYTTGGEKHEKWVYLPVVRRNQTINVRGTLVSNSLQIELKALPWELDENEIDFSTEWNGELEKGEPYKEEEGGGAVVVATSSNGTNRGATFRFRMDSPVGATWMAHLSSTVDFRLEGTTHGVGMENPEWATFTIVPISDYNMESPQEVRLFVTLTSPFGGTMEDGGMQVINPEENGVRPFPGNATEIIVRQVSENAYDALPSGN